MFPNTCKTARHRELVVLLALECGCVGVFGGIEGCYTYSEQRTWGAVLVCPAGLAGLCLRSTCSPDAPSAPEVDVEPYPASLTAHLRSEHIGRGPSGTENRAATLCGNLRGTHFLTALSNARDSCGDSCGGEGGGPDSGLF